MAGDQNSSAKQRPRIGEHLPKKGLIFQESEPQPVLCKPKLLPLKSFTLQKLERMQKEATAKAQEHIQEVRRQRDEEEKLLRQATADSSATPAAASHQSESVTFD